MIFQLLTKPKLLFKILKIVKDNCLKLKYLKKALKSPKEFKRGYHCVYGTFIDAIFYLKPELLSREVYLQLIFRHEMMNTQCLNQGSCIKCGCTTTALQASKPSCEGNCYPEWISDSKFRRDLKMGNNLDMHKVHLYKTSWKSNVR